MAPYETVSDCDIGSLESAIFLSSSDAVDVLEYEAKTKVFHRYLARDFGRPSYHLGKPRHIHPKPTKSVISSFK